MILTKNLRKNYLKILFLVTNIMMNNYDEKKILKIKKFCQFNRRKFFLANRLRSIK